MQGISDGKKYLIKWIYQRLGPSFLSKHGKDAFLVFYDISININAYGLYYTILINWKVWLLGFFEYKGFAKLVDDWFGYRWSFDKHANIIELFKS